jgi:hypothetical protein
VVHRRSGHIEVDAIDVVTGFLLQAFETEGIVKKSFYGL